MGNALKSAALSAAILGSTLAVAPAHAYELPTLQSVQVAPAQEQANERRYHRRNNGWHRGRGHDRRYYGEPVYRDTRIWRGRDGHYYCRKEDGTTGLLIGAAVGGLIGNEVAGRGDKTLGTVLGAVGGAILGRAIDRSNARCR